MGKSHWVVCENCGKKFDVSKKGGAYNNQSKRYTCKSCYRQLKADTSNNPIKAANPGLKKHWKIIVGVLFVISGFYAIGERGISTVIGCIGIGAALILWFFATEMKK